MKNDALFRVFYIQLQTFYYNKVYVYLLLLLYISWLQI